MNIVGRIDGAGGRSGAAGDSGLRHGAAFERTFGRSKAHWPVANADGADTVIAKFFLHRVECHRGGRQRKIAAAPGEFPQAPTPFPPPPPRPAFPATL